MTVSTHLPVTAATRPSVMPSAKDRMVVTKAMPIVMRAPKIRRENMSRPIWSVPNQAAPEDGSQPPPTTWVSP